MAERPTVEELPPLPSELVCALLPMIEPTGGWSSRARIVGLIGSRPGGDYWTAPEVAELTGLSLGTCRRALAALAHDRVIWRDGGSRTARVFWCELNPNVAGWRGVPWTVSSFELRRRIAAHNERVTIEPVWRLIARPMHARCAIAIARLSSRDEGSGEAPEMGSSRALGARDQGPPSGGGSRALGRATRNNVRALQARAISGHFAQEEVLLGRDGENSPPPGDDATGGAADRLDATIIDRACDIVWRVSVPGPGGRKFVADQHRRRIAELSASYGIDLLKRGALAIAGDGHQVPYAVQALGAWLAAEQAGDHEAVIDQAAADTHRPDWLRQRAKVLRSFEGTVDGEAEQERLAELAACEDELGRIDHQEATA